MRLYLIFVTAVCVLFLIMNLLRLPWISYRAKVLVISERQVLHRKKIISHIYEDMKLCGQLYDGLT